VPGSRRTKLNLYCRSDITNQYAAAREYLNKVAPEITKQEVAEAAAAAAAAEEADPVGLRRLRLA